MRTAAIIIARGGSVRLPKKNVRPFCGLPLVAWSILQAKVSHTIDSVYLGTDDEEIADIGREHGAEIIMHPDWGDQSGANRAFIWMIDAIEESGEVFADLVSMLPTGPIRKPADIDRHMELHMKIGARVIGMSRRRETFLYRDLHQICCRNIMMNKTNDLLEHAGFVSASAWGWQRAFQDGLPYDRDIGFDQWFAESPETYPEIDFNYVELDAWQLCDVDTLPEFEMAELQMEHFLLQGRGRSVYDEYAKSKGEHNE